MDLSVELWFLVVVVCELSVAVGHAVPPVPGVLIPVRPEYNHQLDKIVKFFVIVAYGRRGGGYITLSGGRGLKS